MQAVLVKEGRGRRGGGGFSLLPFTHLPACLPTAYHALSPHCPPHATMPALPLIIIIIITITKSILSQFTQEERRGEKEGCCLTLHPCPGEA